MPASRCWSPDCARGSTGRACGWRRSKHRTCRNNARVGGTAHGAGEIGVAQWLQARAARPEPDVRMNPVLLKPEADTQSQVIVRGVVDRGGSFAHLDGTWSLVPEATRARLAGFVLNKFRGDASLLSPGPERPTEMTGMASAGALPMLRHHLPREEGAVEHSHAPAGAPTVLFPRLPFGSNLDEFHLLSHATNVRWVTDAGSIDHLDPIRDMVVLPGSKHVVADMEWMRSHGLDDAVRFAAGRGVRIIGVCGGAMMLDARCTTPRESREVAADETRRCSACSSSTPPCDRASWRPPMWHTGNVLASMLHGLFESPELLRRLFGVHVTPVLDDRFDLLADAVEQHLDTGLLRRLVGT